METRPKSNSAVSGVDLPVLITEAVRLDDNVDVLNSRTHILVDLLTSELKLEEGTVNLVNHEHGLNTLSHGLTKHSTGLDSDTLNSIDDDKSTISHTKSSSHFRREVNVTRRIDQVNEIRVLADFDIRHTVLSENLLSLNNLTGLHVVLKKHTDTSGLDGDTSLLLICTCIRVSRSTCMSGRDDTSLTDERISQSRLAVIDVSDHRHVSDVVLVVHDGPHLIGCEIHHFSTSKS
mmetsp:Transcript_25555/g.37753  ORF Transcript_25555/g.37753 Transcript_25555/m.37753 type:complete len:234 (+) Transcript_25555:2125-2826(+)